MAQKRLIVPDTSVMLPAYFHETMQVDGHEFDLSRRARRLARAVELHEATAFAPHQLLYEFTRRARERLSLRDGSPTDDYETVSEQVSAFFEVMLPLIVWVPSDVVAQQAWELMIQKNLAPPDSWYLACAQMYNAELWVSHWHKDGFVQHARAVYNKVFVLTDVEFDAL